MSLVKNEHELIRLKTDKPDIEPIIKYNGEVYYKEELGSFDLNTSELLITNITDTSVDELTYRFTLNITDCLISDETINVGYINGYIGDADQIEELLYTLDGESEDALLSGYHVPGIIDLCHNDALDNCMCMAEKVVIIERMYIDPALRGLNLLNKAIEQLYTLLGRTTTVMVTMPIPVEMFYGDGPIKNRVADDDEDFQKAAQGLYRALHRAGFHTYGGSSTMWRYFVDNSETNEPDIVKNAEELNKTFCHICNKNPDAFPKHKTYVTGQTIDITDTNRGKKSPYIYQESI